MLSNWRASTHSVVDMLAPKKSPFAMRLREGMILNYLEQHTHSGHILSGLYESTAIGKWLKLAEYDSDWQRK